MRDPPRRRTSSSLTLPRFRDRETEGNRRLYLKRCRDEPERSRPGGSRYCDVNDDDKGAYARKLSQFNETLPRGVLTSMKFEWANLLADKSEKWGFGTENDNVGLGESKRLQEDHGSAINGAPSGRYHLGIKEHVERGLYKEEESVGFNRTVLHYPFISGLKDDYNVTCKEGRHGYCGQTPAAAISQLGRNYVYAEEKRSENDLVYSSMASFGDKYMVQKPMRASIVDSIVEKIDGSSSSMRDDMRQSRELEHNLGSHYQHLHVRKESLSMEREREYSGSRASHISRGSKSMEQEGEYSGSRSCFPEDYEYGSEVNWRGASLQVGEDYGLQRDADDHEEGLKRLQGSDHGGRVVDLTMITRNKEHNFTLDWNSSEQWTSADIERFSDVKNLEVSTLVETSAHNLLSSPFNTISMEEHSSEPAKRSSMDIKKRLGRPAQDMKELLGPAKNSNKQARHSSQVVKRHLRAAPNGRFALSRPKYHEQSKFHRKKLDDFHDDDYFTIENLKTEPIEHNEYFEQLVHGAFMKFVKELYENTAQKTKFTERRGTFTLKCSVCCRNSKEFVDTLSLAMHAFHSQNVGLRAEHLGFHRALCVIMGLNYGATANGSWVPRALPFAEALAVKQDLIIWPPVVFVHNTSMANTSPVERIIVSTEELGSLMKGMGFGWGITKVCRGKAANQSVMVVNFHGTLSGLQEAERLHKLYAENKCGREELEQITFQNRSSIDKTKAEKVEDVLYGYLGIAEDLDKLDFAAKGRIVKSKKEIQAIAGTPFDL